MDIETRTAQVLAVTEDQRENGDESNPIIYAESGPNRFNIMTWFFPEGDGVKVEEDLDLNEVTIHYFNDSGEVKLIDGALYDWALNLYEND